MRLCDVCQAAPASVFITKIVNNDVTKISLCRSCAEKQQADLSNADTLSLQELMEGILSFGLSSTVASANEDESPDDRECPHCGTTAEELRVHGRLGCENCYEVFADRVSSALEQLQAGEEHRGKVAASARELVEMEKRLGSLREALTAAVREERYEEAARLRDELNALNNLMVGRQCKHSVSDSAAASRAERG